MRALAILALMSACGFEAPAQPAGGAHPIANPGTGSSYPLGTTVTLDGSRSFDPDGTIVEYRWSIVQKPAGSTAVPVDASAATTTFSPDESGTYRLQLEVTDDSHNTDRSDVRIVATGAITSIDAGPASAASWLGTPQLSGTVTTFPGKVATYSWSFVSRPAGSLATLQDSTTLSPTFFADAAGTFVVSLEARVGDEVRIDTTMIEVTASGVALGSGNAVYTYAKVADRIVYAHDVGHAEVVEVDPMTGAQSALDIGTFTPRSISVDDIGQVVAVGAPGKVATVSVGSQLALLRARDVPGCTAAQVIIPFTDRVDCFPADGDLEPISSVYMPTGVVTQIPCPVRFPSVTLGGPSWMYMVDGASSQFYRFDAWATPPLPILDHGDLAGIAPPVIAAGTNLPFAVTGNGLVINLDVTLRFDLHTHVSAGAFSGIHYEIAVVSGSQLKLFDAMNGSLKLTVTLPPVSGFIPTAKLVAYSADEHRLIVVASTNLGDIAYTVPR